MNPTDAPRTLFDLVLQLLTLRRKPALAPVPVAARRPAPVRSITAARRRLE